MATKPKPFTVGFFEGRVGADGNAGKVSAKLAEMVETGIHPVIQIAQENYEIRNLKSNDGQNSFEGVFAKIRHEDIPHLGAFGGLEREIPLQEEEGVIEKNHFVFYKKNELLVYQMNFHGSSISKLGTYFTKLFEKTTIFAPVLQPDAMARLMKGGVEIRRLELSFARPTNPEWYPADEWNRSLIEVMRGPGGARINVKISADRKSKEKIPRLSNLKQAMGELLGNVNASKAELLVDERGQEHPIDLISDRIKAKIKVEMLGRYPNPKQMFLALRGAKDEHNDSLTKIFGEDSDALD